MITLRMCRLIRPESFMFNRSMRIRGFLSPFSSSRSSANAEDWSHLSRSERHGYRPHQNTSRTRWDASSIVWKPQLPPTAGQSSAVGAGSKIFCHFRGDTDGARRHFLPMRSTKDNGTLLGSEPYDPPSPESVHRMNGWGTPTPDNRRQESRRLFRTGRLEHCFDMER